MLMMTSVFYDEEDDDYQEAGDESGNDLILFLGRMAGYGAFQMMMLIMLIMMTAVTAMTAMRVMMISTLQQHQPPYETLAQGSREPSQNRD